MHPFLTRLAVGAAVQDFFEPFYRNDEQGNLIFDYGDGVEHFGFAFHKIPVSRNFWMAGNRNFSQIREVVICCSAMEAVSWLKNKQSVFQEYDNLLLLSAGTVVRDEHSQWLGKAFVNKDFRFVFGHDLPGRIADLKLAAGIRRWPLKLYLDNNDITVSFRSRCFSFSQDTFSLSAFEKAAKFRFGVTCDKPGAYNSYFDLLKASAFFTSNS